VGVHEGIGVPQDVDVHASELWIHARKTNQQLQE
jgi:hypothetical protein